MESSRSESRLIERLRSAATAKLKPISPAAGFLVLLALGCLVVTFAYGAEAEGAARLDRSFGGDGVVVRAGDKLSGGSSIAEDSRGRLTVVGEWQESGDEECSDYFAARFLGNGSPDESLRIGGLMLGGHPCTYMNSLASYPDGGFVLAGGYLSCSVLNRFSENGKVQPSWNDGSGDGRHLICPGYKPGIGYSWTNDLAIDKRGRILGAGLSETGPNRSVAMVYRATRKGRLDKTFVGSPTNRWGTPGMIRIQRSGKTWNEAVEVKALGNGRILAAGTARGNFMVAQLRNNGSPDGKFGNEGVFAFNADKLRCECSEVQAMVRDYRKRIILAGVTFVRKGVQGTIGNVRLTIIRVTPDGRLDRTFGQNGIARPPRTGTGATGIAVQKDGKIVLSVVRDNKFSVIRLNRRGNLDKTFFRDGIYSRKPFGRLGGQASDVIVDRRGRIVVVGGSYAYPPSSNKLALLRFLPR